MADRSVRMRLPLVAAILVVGAVWLMLARLALAFWRSELDWTYVAEQSRIGAPWYYRVAGVWGGMEGSLLLFAGIVGVCGLLATRRAPRAAWVVAATTGALLAVDIGVASPFDRLKVPAVEGFGLTPILEHPAMTVHPPALYLGFGLAFGAFVIALGRRDAWPLARPWLLGSVTTLTLAMTLGAVWSYAEQGWGGYWAWDPVENTSLLVWLAALAAMHAIPGAPGARGYLVVPWMVATFGAALNRSGATPSVHSFAEQAAVGWWLAAVAAVTVAVAVAVLRQHARRPRIRSRAGVGVGAAALLAVIALVVAAGVVVPVVIDLVADRPNAVRGEFYSRTVGPLALLALAAVVGHIRRRGWAGFAHGSMVVLLVGIGASTFDRIDTVPIEEGATTEAAGVSITNHGVDVVPGPRDDADSVVASLDVGGRSMSPSLVVYRANGGRLAESEIRPGLLYDTQVMLDDADDSGAVVITIHRRPLVWLIWLGAVLVTVATLGAAIPRRRRDDAARASPTAEEAEADRRRVRLS